MCTSVIIFVYTLSNLTSTCLQTTKYWKSHHILPMKHARVIAEEMRGQIRRGENQIWIKQPLNLPAVIPTTSTSNNPFNFFEVDYKIKVIVTLLLTFNY